MKPRDDLFALILSLDKNERRYFSLYAQARHLKNGAKFLELFAAISKQDSYDEEALKATLQDQPWVKQLSAEKAALYQCILDAMGSYQQPTQRERVHLLLRQARFLRGKGLNAQVERCLAKASAIVQECEALPEILLVEDERRSLLKEQSVKGREEGLLASWLQSRSSLEALMQESRLREILDHIFHLARQKFLLRSPEERQALEKWMDDPCLNPETKLASFQATASRHNIWAIYHQLRGESILAHHWFAQNRQYWEAHPHRIQHYTVGYLTTMANYLHSCCLVGDFEAIPAAVAHLQTLEVSNWNEEAERFQNYYYYLLLYHLNRFDMEPVLALVPDITAGLAKYGAKINQARALGFLYNIAIAHFLAEKFKDAKRWFQQTIDGAEGENRIDIRQTGRMMLLICHLELDDEALFESIYLSAYRHLQRHERLLAAERMIFSHLQAIAQASPRNHLPTLLQAFLGDLLELQRDPNAALPPGIQELTYWVRSRIEHRPMISIARQAPPPATPNVN